MTTTKAGTMTPDEIDAADLLIRRTLTIDGQVTTRHPGPRSLTERRSRIASARVRLAHAANALSAKPDPQVVLDLLWARALASRALAVQTRDQAGDRYATAATEASLLGLIK